MSPEFAADRDKLAFGYFDDFNEPMLLLWGSALALKQLQDLLRAFASGGKAEMLFAELPWVSPRRNTHLSLEFDPAARGLARVADTSQPAFVWRLSREAARTFADKIEPLANASFPCHQYLEANKDECIVKVSFGEYDAPDAF